MAKQNNMKKHQFKVGDRVRIRAWDDMVKEFGTDAGEAIPCGDEFFVPAMRHLCGREASIVKIDEKFVVMNDWSDKSGNVTWVFTTSMIEPVEHECRYCGVMTTQPDEECYKATDSSDLLKRAVEALDDYLNAGCKKTRSAAAEKAKAVYSEYYGKEYVNRADRNLS
jgi:hypothetical protein